MKTEAIIKKALLMIIFLPIITFSQSSVYKPFCVNPSWTSGATNFGITWYDSYHYVTDTVIAPYTYKKIYSVSTPSVYVLFREVVSQKKVYSFNQSSMLDYLYIDFNLAVGNTFTVNVFGVAETTTVTVKDSMLINGCYHNRLFLSRNGSITYPEGYYYTEGILSHINPVHPYYWTGDPVNRLVCECHNGMDYYYYSYSGVFSCNFSCSPNTNSACANITTVNESQGANNLIDLYPNPATNELFVFAKNYERLNVKLYNMMGAFVLNQTITSAQHIDLTDLTNGVYIYKVYTKDTELKIGKLIISK